MTAWKRRTEKSTACWAAPPPISLSPPAISRAVKIVAVVGDDFAQEDTICWRRATSISPVWSAFPARRSSGRGVYSADMNDRTTLRTDLNVFADFNPKLPESYRSASRTCCWATSSPSCSAACARR